MRWSLPLGQFRGIKVYIHWTFLLLLLWVAVTSYRVAQDTAPVLWTLGYLLAIFACVVLHEFGHALTARRFGITTRDITLLPIGGMARMDKMPEKPMHELLVAIAGPLVNIAIAGGLFLYMHFSPKSYVLAFPPQGIRSAEELLPMLFTVNLLMAAFNLIPAFPMDGGRVLRSLLALKLPRARATQIAANLGQVIAIVFIFLGFFYNLWLIFIGIFIYLGAGAEATQENIRHDLGVYTVGQLVMHKFTLLHAEDTLSQALRALLDSQEREFLVTEGGVVAGILTRDTMLAGLARFGQNVPIGQVMRRDIRILPPQMPVTEALQIMTENDLPLLPVGYEGQLLGVIDLENISEFLLIQKAIR
ncbi:MAG: site-2 protease family protein [candidate division KSB1 bacterium]|nr:site-2 protease family protein [candidate division KSB1 bacterium]